MRIWFVLTVIHFFFVFLPNQSGATPISRPSQALEIALSDVKPFAYKKKEVLLGINIDQAKQISQLSGIAFHYNLYPHLRLVKSLDDIAPDAAVMFTEACEKYKKYEVRGRLYNIKRYVFLSASASLKTKGLRIGRILGTCTADVEKLIQPAMTDISDMYQGIEMLRARRLDGVCGLKPVIQTSLDARKKLHEKIVPITIDTKGLDAVLCVKKSLSTQTKEKLEQAVQQSKAVGIN